MPRVDFYILPNQGTRERFTCDIASKIHRQKLDLYIHASSREEARLLDDFMWTYKDISFLPHGLINENTGSNTITIGWEGEVSNNKEVLINLSSDVPEFVDNFERIIEIVPPDDADRQRARDRYRQYRQAGFELHNHDLNSVHDLA